MHLLFIAWFISNFTVKQGLRIVTSVRLLTFKWHSKCNRCFASVKSVNKEYLIRDCRWKYNMCIEGIGMNFYEKKVQSWNLVEITKLYRTFHVRISCYLNEQYCYLLAWTLVYCAKGKIMVMIMWVRKNTVLVCTTKMGKAWRVPFRNINLMLVECREVTGQKVAQEHFESA